MQANSWLPLARPGVKLATAVSVSGVGYLTDG